MFTRQTLISVVLQLNQLHSAGVNIESHMIRNLISKENGLAKYEVAQISRVVKSELADMKRKNGLPLAISAEAIFDQCVEIDLRPKNKERK